MRASRSVKASSSLLWYVVLRFVVVIDPSVHVYLRSIARISFPSSTSRSTPLLSIHHVRSDVHVRSRVFLPGSIHRLHPQRLDRVVRFFLFPFLPTCPCVVRLLSFLSPGGVAVRSFACVWSVPILACALHVGRRAHRTTQGERGQTHSTPHHTTQIHTNPQRVRESEGQEERGTGREGEGVRGMETQGD